MRVRSRTGLHRIILPASLLVAAIGCGDGSGNADAGKTAGQGKPETALGRRLPFARGATLDYRLEIDGVNKGTIQTQFQQRIDYSVGGSIRNSVDIFLRRVQVNLKQFAGGRARELAVLDLSRTGVRGRVAGKDWPTVTQATAKELDTFARKLTNSAYARVALDGQGRPGDSKRLAPPETDVVVSPAIIDYVSFLLAPPRLTSRQWSQTVRWPMDAGLSATGTVQYKIADADWRRKDRGWFFHVEVSGKFSADGKHTAQVPTNFPDAKAGKTQTRTVEYSNSDYRVSGRLLYSRQVQQFVGGQLRLKAQHTASSGGQTINANTSGTLKLSLQKATPVLSLPKMSQKIEAASPRFQVDTTQRRLLEHSRFTGMGWDLRLDWRFPKGVVRAIANKDESQVFVLSQEGRLACIEIAGLAVVRSVDLGPCLAMAPCNDRLAVLRKNPRELIVLDRKTFQVKAAWKVPDAETMESSSGSDWVTLGRNAADYLTIVDTTTGTAVYSIDGADLQRIPPAVKGPGKRQRPERLRRGNVSADGKQFVALGRGFHRLQKRDGELFYAEDSPPVEADGDLLLFSNTDKLLAIRSPRGLKAELKGAAASVPGVYIFALEDPLRFVGMMTERGGRVDAFAGRRLVVRGKTDSRMLTAYGPIPQSSRFSPVVHTGWARQELRERMAVVPFRDGSALFLGEKSSIWSRPGKAAPNILSEDLPLPLRKITSQVAKVAGPAPEKRGGCVVTSLPDRIHIEGSRPQVVTSLDGRHLFALTASRPRAIIEIRVRDKVVTRRVDFPSPSGATRLRHLRIAGPRLVASDGSGRVHFVFDGETLNCLGQIALVLQAPVATARGKPLLMTRDQRGTSLILMDLVSLTRRQLFPEHIEGWKGRLDNNRREGRPRAIQLDDAGGRFAIDSGESLFVARLSPAKMLWQRSLPPTHGSRRHLGGNRIALLTTERPTSLLTWDWTIESAKAVVIPLPVGFEPGWFDAASDRVIVFSNRGIAKALDQKGRVVAEFRPLLKAPATTTRRIAYAARNATEVALYDSIKKVLYWCQAQPPANGRGTGF